MYLTVLKCIFQAFNKDADNIDSVTSSHEKFLDFNDIGVCKSQNKKFWLFIRHKTKKFMVLRKQFFKL